jgi:anti-sigma factor RsiW
MAYLDGELAANEAARVAAHLTACAECRQLEADLRSVSAQMLTWNVEPAPPQMRKLFARIRRRIPRRSRGICSDLYLKTEFALRDGHWPARALPLPR